MTGLPTTAAVVALHIGERVISSGQMLAVVRQSSSIRAILLLSLTMVLAIVLGTVLLLVDLRQKEIAHARDGILSLSRILAEQTTRTIDGVTLSMRGAKERLSDNIGQMLDLSSGPVRLLLQARITGLPQVKSRFVVNADGMVVNSSRNDVKPPLSAANRDFFRHFANSDNDDLFISLPERAKIDGQWTFYLSNRLSGVDGSFRGVLVSAINIEHFQQQYESITMDFVSRISLLNPEGVLMVSDDQDHKLIGKSVINLATILGSGPSAVQDSIVVGEDVAGEAWLTAYRTVSNYPLIVSPSVSERTILAPWHQLALPIVGFALAVATFILITTFIVARNLIRRERLELDLKESDEQLRHMVQSARDAILTVDRSRRVVLFNSAAERMFRAQASDVLGEPIDDFLARSQHPKLAANLMRYLDEGWNAPPGMALLGIIALSDDKIEFPVELSLSTTTVHGELLITAIFRDLSDRQRIEYQLVEKNMQLRQLTSTLENVREEERSRISRELHDELGQSLTGIRMEASWLGGRLQAVQPEMGAKVSELKKTIDGTIAAVRRISSELRPLVLDDLGFSAAANWYIDQFSARSGIDVSADLLDSDPPHGSATATALFRALQESLTNVARHAEAKRVAVSLKHVDGEWQLSIHDDGKGFDEAKISQQRGIGLIGMRERVQMLGGTFRLKSAPNQGTSVEISIPAEQL